MVKRGYKKVSLWGLLKRFKQMLYVSNSHIKFEDLRKAFKKYFAINYSQHKVVRKLQGLKIVLENVMLYCDKQYSTKGKDRVLFDWLIDNLADTSNIYVYNNALWSQKVMKPTNLVKHICYIIENSQQKEMLGLMNWWGRGQQELTWKGASLINFLSSRSCTMIKWMWVITCCNHKLRTILSTASQT